ncbi:MAG TPA: FG-GAP-like repeat-containing protein, partial [Phycisphaerae bacterium]|nr:FG-GAP-like repeat-containing protein [Phycisphaerae bacterium]
MSSVVECLIRRGRFAMGVVVVVSLAFVSTSAAGVTDCDSNGVDDVVDTAPAFAPGYSTNAPNSGALLLADMDSDGDADLVVASSTLQKIEWHRNLNGLGDFGDAIIIDGDAHGVKHLVAVDLDGDGDNDLLSARLFDSAIDWYENRDGAGGFSARKTIVSFANGAVAAIPADMDGDGDLDIVS